MMSILIILITKTNQVFIIIIAFIIFTNIINKHLFKCFQSFPAFNLILID